jgi:uncharacterized protein YndB with AHSA1/START domain
MSSDAATFDGTLERADRGARVRFERRLDHPPEAVWSALTEPDRIGRWLARATLQPERGGSLQLRWDETGAVAHGTVTAFEPPARFAYDTDSQGDVRFALHPEGEGTRLELVNEMPAADAPAGRLAGWHQHLDLLERELAGEPSEWDTRRFEELRERYSAE